MALRIFPLIPSAIALGLWLAGAGAIAQSRRPELFEQNRRPEQPASVVVPTTGDSVAPPKSYRWTDSAIARLEQDTLQKVNQYRLSKGLSPLRSDPRLAEQARRHSREMASRRITFGHPGFRRRVRAIDRQIPSRRVGENVAYIFSQTDPSDRAFQGWLRSTQHRNNMEDRFDLTGIGIAQDDKGAFFMTQIFVQQR